MCTAAQIFIKGPMQSCCRLCFTATKLLVPTSWTTIFEIVPSYIASFVWWVWMAFPKICITKNGILAVNTILGWGSLCTKTTATLQYGQWSWIIQVSPDWSSKLRLLSHEVRYWPITLVSDFVSTIEDETIWTEFTIITEIFVNHQNTSKCTQLQPKYQLPCFKF